MRHALEVSETVLKSLSLRIVEVAKQAGPSLNTPELQELNKLLRTLRRVLHPFRLRLTKAERRVHTWLMQVHTDYASLTLAHVRGKFGYSQARALIVARGLDSKGYIKLMATGEIELIDAVAEDPLVGFINGLVCENSRLRIALNDAIRRPLGVVPLRAEPYFDPQPGDPEWITWESGICNLIDMPYGEFLAQTAQGTDFSGLISQEGLPRPARKKRKYNARTATGNDTSTSQQPDSQNESSTN